MHHRKAAYLGGVTNIIVTQHPVRRTLWLPWIVGKFIGYTLDCRKIQSIPWIVGKLTGYTLDCRHTFLLLLREFVFACPQQSSVVAGSFSEWIFSARLITCYFQVTHCSINAYLHLSEPRSLPSIVGQIINKTEI